MNEAAVAYYRRIVAAADEGDLRTGLAICEDALKELPRNADLVGMAGKLCWDMHAWADAEQYFSRYVRLQPKQPGGYFGLGMARKEQGDYRRALRDLRRACKLAPDNEEYRLNLGNVEEITGDLKEARASFEEALRIKPDFAEAFRKLAGHKSFQTDDPVLARMASLATQPDTSPKAAGNLHFALADIYDKAGEAETAFHHFQLGNAIKRKSLKGYDPDIVLRRIARTARIFRDDLFARFEGAGNTDDRPVFIVGMPRSGTTLVEQILASHSKVFAAGETRFLETQIADYITQARPARDYPEFVPSFDADNLKDMGSAYLGLISKDAGNALRITDKMPQNFIYAGLIRLLLPNARIIHCRRDPVDTCFSCFKKYFMDDVPFTFSLDDLANYYKSYHALMQHWRDVLPGGMLEIDYEAVVDDLEGEARRLIEYCGLDWEPACLDFHKTKRDVATASNLQVRQPIYRSAVQAWKPYEAYLGPLLALKSQ
ncbi:MAG: sulfotransferase [Rhodospirillales bacterium]